MDDADRRSVRTADERDDAHVTRPCRNLAVACWTLLNVELDNNGPRPAAPRVLPTFALLRFR